MAAFRDMPLIFGIADEVLMALTLLGAGACMLLQACCCCAPCARHACFGGRTAAPGEGGGPAPEAREDVCAVCLDAATHPCLTSCNHQFCTGCLHQYWQAQFAPAAVKCPMCRQEVVALVPVGDTEADAAAAE